MALYYIAVSPQAELHVVDEASALYVHKEDLFGPYRSYEEALNAGLCAEMTVYYLVESLG